MAWRRFTSGSFGSLSARQYTEMQDTVAALASRSGVSTAKGAPSDRHMLVKIGAIYGESRLGEPPSTEGSQAIDATAYLFEQVHVRFRRDNGRVEIATRDYGIKSRASEDQDEDLTLVAIDPRPFSNIPSGSLAIVLPLDVDAGADLSELPPQQGLYIILRAFNPPAIGIYEITGQGGQLGNYFGVPIPQSDPDTDYDPEPVPIINLYETSGYYGALGGTNACVQLTPGALRIGDQVPVVSFGGTFYTMAPIGFAAECRPCTPTSGLAATDPNAQAIEMAVASIVLRA